MAHHHHKSPLVKTVGMLSWVITALTAIHVGLCPLGYNLLRTEMMQMRFPALVAPVQYLVGLAGLVSLLMLVMAWTQKCTCHPAE